MAKTNRQILQHLRTTRPIGEVQSLLKDNAAQGEIAIQYDGDGASGTSLWTLAKDGATAVQFVNKEQVDDMIKHGAVAEVDKIEQAVGLADDGSYIKKSGTNYLNDATTVEGEIEALDEALNGVQVQINGMNADSVADDNKIVSDVTQANGKITATSKNVTEVKLGGYTVGGDDSGKVAATDTLGQALGKLQGQINAMDKTAEAVAGQVVTTISEEDGKVSETKANVKDLQLGGYEKDANATGAIAGTDTINAALSKLENKANAITISNADKSINVTSSATGTDINVNIKSDEKVIKKGEGGLFTDIKISGATAQELVDLGANVKEAYKLLDSDGGQLGDWIKIYKDSALKEVYLGHVDDKLADASSPVVTSGTGETALCFIYYTVEGKYQLVAVNVESFLQESEFKDGLSVDNHQVKVKIDADSEKDSQQDVNAPFLTVGLDGLKLSGIKEEITRKIAALDYDDTAVTGQYVTKVDEADGKISVARANVSDAVLNGYKKGEKPESTAIAATDDVKGAFAKLEHQIDNAKAAATTKVAKDALANHLTLASSTAADGSVTYTIGESDIASKTALDAEIEARKAVDGQNGQTYTANADANYISAVTSLNAADVQLDAILGKDETAGEGNTGNTVFNKTNTVAKNISDIKKDLAAFKSKLTLSGKANAYAEVTVKSDATGTTIEVSAKTQSIATSTAEKQGLADAYDVRTFAVSDVSQESDAATSGVHVKEVGGNKVLDFSGLKIDCGEF